jgi:hypothetical protein
LFCALLLSHDLLLLIHLAGDTVFVENPSFSSPFLAGCSDSRIDLNSDFLLGKETNFFSLGSPGTKFSLNILELKQAYFELPTRFSTPK